MRKTNIPSYFSVPVIGQRSEPWLKPVLTLELACGDERMKVKGYLCRLRMKP